MKKDTTTARTMLLQDLGMLLFLVSLFAGSAITALSSQELLLQNMLLLMGLFLCAVLVLFHARYAAVVITAFEILALAVYKLYQYFANGVTIELTAYFWGFVLLTLLAGLTLFIREYAATELANSILHEQVEELTVVDPLTGLENLRSMYSGTARIMALARRNGTPIVLMLVKLRYAEELSRILSRATYERLRQRVAEIAQDTLRLEDRVYSIDRSGSLGILCFCSAEGAQTVKGRLLNAYGEKDAFAGIAEKPLKVEMRIAYLPYDAAYGTNAIEYRQKVESELQYDV